ncbi:MAG: HAD family hydrolase [Micromonosporaceae bacterium]
MIRQPCEALLVDLDGVLRVFDPGHLPRVEQRHGLAAGAISQAAFATDPLRRVVTGQISHDEWLAATAESLTGSVATKLVAGLASGPAAEQVGEPVAVAAVAEWASHRGSVQSEELAVVREVRAAGIPVAIASNASDWLDADLDALGLLGEVDVVVNSSVVGHAKPSAEFFAAACRAVAVPPARCLFVDDDTRNVTGARAAGLAAYRYTGTADLRYVRAAVTGPREASG